ncbi:MAG: PAS domain S-box protein [Oligoflexales bacterium]|nr:PAS domain S-box protein [Oligoflexales bacterium]
MPKNEEIESADKMHVNWADIFNSTFDAIFLCKQTGEIVQVNRAGHMMLGYSSEDLIKRSIFELIKDVSDEEEEEDLFEAVELKKLFQKGMINNRRIVLLSKDKTEIPTLFTVTLLETSEKVTLAVCAVKDITALEESLRNLEKERSASVNAAKLIALGEMAAGLAHELNTPLAVIMGRCYYLKDALSAEAIDKELCCEMLQSIEEMTNKISGIIKGLRGISRNSQNDPFSNIEFKEILNDTIAFCKYKLDYMSIVLEVNNMAEGAKIQCRPAEISQVILNLMNNACDAISTLENRWIKIDVVKRTNLEISITDSGPMIPEEIQEKIMQPFFTTKEVGKGTGLGLSICQNILENHGGRLTLEKGSPNTKFVITLPFKAPSQEQEQ